ncbi:protein of unknown function [Actinopolyspora mzabensis]|uniref:DUF397 domain-containing protein n=1 Tax=Actinopolyspora mzabensis TaxID=995066 RepID=A0A1G9AMM6_ACTMZ|nr:DUF397 domain-containing protein [Actinopolyspora mzabensis]SDK28547.1 protein of unknown function [Actinopolyspora mzabensis]
MRFTAHAWQKSSYSNDDQGCVEVALSSRAVGIRDTKDRASGTLTVTPAAWAEFMDRLKTGGYDQG